MSVESAVALPKDQRDMKVVQVCPTIACSSHSAMSEFSLFRRFDSSFSSSAGACLFNSKSAYATTAGSGSLHLDYVSREDLFLLVKWHQPETVMAEQMINYFSRLLALHLLCAPFRYINLSNKTHHHLSNKYVQRYSNEITE
jgi:hypothetical protein